MTERPSKYLSVGDKGRVTLPEEMRSTLVVRKGDLLVYERTERGYEIMPAALVPADQRWFYHPEMHERIAEAERQIAAGEVTVLPRRRGASVPRRPQEAASRRRLRCRAHLESDSETRRLPRPGGRATTRWTRRTAYNVTRPCSP